MAYWKNVVTSGFEKGAGFDLMRNAISVRSGKGRHLQRIPRRVELWGEARVSEGPDQIPSQENIEKHISELKSKKGSLRAERGLLVETVRGLRATTSESKGRSLSRKKYLSLFNENKEIANAKRKERDDINLAIPPPVSCLLYTSPSPRD